MTDTEEPPTKLTKMETTSIDSAEEGQEEWLSDGILTDEEYTANGNAPNNSSQDETMESMVEESQQMDNIEDTLNNLDSSCATDPEVDELDKFLIRKAEAKAEKMDDDCNSTEDLLRLLGEKDEKPVKVESEVQPEGECTTDDEIENLINPQGRKMKTLQLAKTVLKKTAPTKAEPEDSGSDIEEDLSNISKITSVESKRAVLRSGRLRGNFAAKSTTPKSTPKPVGQTKEIVQFKVTSQPISSTPIKKEVSKPQLRSSKVENVIKMNKSVENVKEKQPSKQAPSKQAPIKQAPNKQAPNKQAPNKQAPSKQAPSKQLKLTEIEKQMQGKQIQFKQIQKKDVPSNLISSKQILSREILSTQAPSKQQPSKQSQLQKIDNLRPGQIKFEQSKSKSSKFMELKFKLPTPEQQTRAELSRSVNKIKFDKDDKGDEGSSDENSFNDNSKVKDEFKSTNKQKIMKPEEIDEEGLSDEEDSLSDVSWYDDMPSTEVESDAEDWFTFDIRAERAGDYLPLLGPRAQEMLSEEKRLVSERVTALKQSLSALTDSARLQVGQLKSATATLAELDAMLAAV